MPEHKTFFGKLLASIFGGFFRSAKKTYNNLPQEQKDAILHGAGIVNLLNTMLDKTAAQIRTEIQKKYPDMDVAKAEAALFALANAFKLTTTNNIDDVVHSLQHYLQSKEGVIWADASRSAASLLAYFIGPPETKFEAIASLIGTVYQWLVKKKK